MVERVSRRALLLIGAEKAIVWPIEGYWKLYKQAKELKNLVALLVTHCEIYAGQREPWGVAPDRALYAGTTSWNSMRMPSGS